MHEEGERGAKDIKNISNKITEEKNFKFRARDAHPDARDTKDAKQDQRRNSLNYITIKTLSI